jgi:Tol biopolymer transport system component/regulation of enolase protein 1 (concanavalin A-like superfamily)
MKKTNLLPALLALPVLATPISGLASPNGGPLGDFEAHGDVGSPKIAGHATYNAASQVYTLSAGGVNIWAKRDEFHYAYRKMKGDFIIQAQVEFQGKGVDPHRKAGIMARASIADFDSAYVDGAFHGDGLTSLQFRKAKGEDTAQTEMPAAKGATVMQLERRGNVFILSAARFGEPFEVAQVTDATYVPEETYVGLFLSAHNPEVEETAVFRNVRVIKPVKVGFTPYRDYIGSRLELLNVANGHRSVIYSSRVPFEAPNWLPDGSALLYNASGGDPATRGRLWRFDLQTRTPTLIDTGFAIRNNNDHVLSFDGSQLAISDQSTDAGQSTIFTLPVRGGTPKRITPNTPSYMHSWTPDAKWLVYTGGRIPKGGKDNEFDIYKIASDGSGKEINLTNSPGLDDGPEVSPDGRWIYFNSTRSGQMQIWRMGLDGKNVERVTNDHKWNDWFPHFSPDGKWITIISYGLDVEASNHPYYKHCMIRLMPADGSAPPKTIAYVYGGQGTINVPSWSPDGTHVAFVSNSDLLTN